MGMVAQYVRMTPAELRRTVRDPEWAEEFVNDVLDAEVDAELDPEVPSPDPARRRGCDTEKAWDALRILLHRVATVDPCPFLGGEPFGDVWSYDRPRILSADDTARLAEQLAGTAFDALARAYDPDALRQAYLAPWSMEDVLALRETYDDLVLHFRAAARAGDGMIVYIA